MKVAVVGCGAVGSYYGARLCRAGHDVHFLLRSDYNEVARSGLMVKSPLGDFTVRPRAARTPEEIGASEMVLVGLKTTANAQFSSLLPPLVAEGTAVLTLQNGLGNEEQLARLFRVESILGGLCFVCLNRLKPGLIHHMAHGQVILGEHLRRPETRTHGIAEMFRQAQVPCAVTEDLAQAHWDKLTWNIPFNGLGVAGVAGYDAVVSGRVPAGRSLRSRAAGTCLSTDVLLASEKWSRLVRELMMEVISAARALGHALPTSLADTQIERTRCMGAYRASTLIDFERGQPLELESLFLEPLRQAKSAGVPTPRLERMCEVLKWLDGTGSAGLLRVRFAGGDVP